MYSICVPERGTIVFLRVRIITGGASCVPVMMPSSVGSFDMAISDSTAPASRSWPIISRWCMPRSTSRARATDSSEPSIWMRLPRAAI